MHVARFGVHGFDEVFAEACTSSTAFEPQLAGSRAAWLLEMVDPALIETLIGPRILSAFRDRFLERDRWDKVQLCEFALALAKRGLPGSRAALYSSIHKDPESSSYYAVDEIIQLDGSDGLLFVADKIGQWVIDDPEMCVYFSIVEVYDEVNDQGGGVRILRAAAEHNPRIAALLEYMREFDVEVEEPDASIAFDATDVASQPDRSAVVRYRDMKHWTAAELIQDIEETDPAENPRRMLYMHWGQNAPDKEVSLVYEALCVETSPGRIRLLLSVFQRRGFLEVSARTLQFAESDDAQIRWSAYACLAAHCHDAVRALALRQIQAGRMIEGELGMLVKNHRPGDWDIIREAQPTPDDPFDLHRMLQDLLEIYEQVPSSESVEPLLVVYEHTPCSVCRESAVKVLLQLGALPDWVREECRFDANEDTRGLVAPV